MASHSSRPHDNATILSARRQVVFSTLMGMSAVLVMVECAAGGPPCLVISPASGPLLSSERADGNRRHAHVTESVAAGGGGVTMLGVEVHY